MSTETPSPTEAPKKWSQNDEEAILAKYFTEHPPKHGNRLLDVGAWDGKNLSNTWPYVVAGWQAALIEAAAGPFAELIRNCQPYPNAKLVNAFVIGKSTPRTEIGLAVMYHTHDAVSTADSRVYNAWKSQVRDYRPIMVAQVPMENILKVFPGPYDLISIDTEGETLSIFKDIIEGVESSVIVVEHSVGGVCSLDEMRAMATAAGYTELSVNGENLLITK